MKLRLDLRGIIVQLQIRDYNPGLKDDCFNAWCKVDFSFSSEPWLNYEQNDAEVFVSYEVSDLYFILKRLLCDELTEIEELDVREPDFNYTLHPKFDIRNDPKVAYVAPGHEIRDIFMDWRVCFWHDGLTPNYLSVSLKRKEIQYLCNYFGLVTGQLSETDPAVRSMADAGVLIQ